MRRLISITRFLAAVVAGCLVGTVITQARKPDNPPGGGGDPAPYLIIELPSLVPNQGVLTESISEVSADGCIYVVGKANGGRACLWTIDADLAVVAEDLGDWLYDTSLDVNSAGVVAGLRPGDLTPVLLMPDGQLVDLPEATDVRPGINRVRINNPDESGVFQAVRSHVLFDVSMDGTILATTLLEDPSGTPLYATDINDSDQIAGFVVENNVDVPAVGEFTGEGELLITTLVSPDPGIDGFVDMQIDHAGNVLGDGWEGPGYERGVVWLASGGAIDLAAELGTVFASGEGIASVNGAMQCVGAWYDRDIKAYVYSAGASFDLQDSDSTWFAIDLAGDINSSGVICARGKVGKRRNYRLAGCLLIPVQP